MDNLKKVLCGITAAMLVVSQSFTAVVYGATGLDDPEFDSALAWMHENGLTQYQTVDEYRPFDTLTREQAAKFYSEFAKTTLGETPEETGECQFNDLDSADPTLQDSMVDACQMGLFQGSDGNFMPKQPLTKAQSIAVLIRALDGKKDENVFPWWKNYFTQARELGLTKETDVMALDREVTRYEIGLMLYRASGEKETAEGEEDIEDILGGLLGDGEEDETDETDESDETDETDQDGETDETDEEDETDEGSDVSGSVVEVTLNPNTPAAQDIPSNVSTVEYMKFDLSAGSEDVTIDAMDFVRKGLGSDDDFDKVRILEDGVTVSNDRSVRSNDEVNFNNLDLVIPANSTKTYTLVAGMDTDTGRSNRFALTNVDASADVEGDLPIEGNTMKTVDYKAAELTFDKRGIDTTVDVGTEQETVGEFELEETQGDSSQDVVVQSVRLENQGGADIEESLRNISLENRGDSVAEDVSVNGDYVTFNFEDDFVIEDGDSERFEIKADIVAGDDGDDIQFNLDETYDIYGTELNSGVGISVTLGDTPLQTYTINAGKFTVSKDTSSPSSEEYAPDTDDVKILVANTDVGQAVRIGDGLRVFVNKFTPGTGNATVESFENSFENFKLEINDSTITTVDELTSNDSDVDSGDYIDFDTSFDIEDDDKITIYADITNDANGDDELELKIDNSSSNDGNSKSFRDVEYVDSGENVSEDDFAGTATSNPITVKSSSEGVSITRNDGNTSSEVFLGGEDEAELMQFVINAGNVSSLNVDRLTFNLDLSGATYNDFTSMKIMQDGQQVGTTEDLNEGDSVDGTVTIEDIDSEIEKNAQKQYKFVANIDTSVTDGNLEVELDAESSVFYDNNDDTMELDSDYNITSPKMQLKDNAQLTVSQSGDTPNEQIITANTNDVEVARYKFEATDGQVILKDLYVANVDDSDNVTDDADARVNGFNLVVDGETVDSRVPSNGKVHFNLGSDNQIELPKDESQEVLVTADLNNISDDNQTNKEIKLALRDMEAETTATSNDLTEVNGSTSIDNSDHYTGVNLDIQGKSQYVRKTQPTLATQDISASLSNGNEKTIYEVSVSADSNEDVEIGQIGFEVSENEESGSNNITDDYKLYVDGENQSDGETTSYDVDGNPSDNGDDMIFTFKDGEEVSVSAGSSKTFELKADIDHADDSGDSVSVRVLEDNTMDAGTFSDLGDSPNVQDATATSNTYVDNDDNDVVSDGDTRNNDVTQYAANVTGASDDGLTGNVAELTGTYSTGSFTIAEDGTGNSTVSVTNVNGLNYNSIGLSSAISTGASETTIVDFDEATVKVDLTNTTNASGTVDVEITENGSYAVDSTVNAGDSDAGLTLDTVSTNDYNLIWSDHAGSPHSRTTADWFNGYQVNGLDTDSFTVSY